ncbi:MAG: VIT1/CCC1 transporter family protein [Candidatus Micrarchaeota archaeon]|nr:VIT1/CCC1 transporter family protein [Candidatus Micrarchaeota archaeon]
MLRFFRNLSRRLGHYDTIIGIGHIARRYFVMNAFDGALTMLGMIIGSYAAGIQNPMLVFMVGMSTSVAVGISGLWGAFMTETAERKRQLRELEKQMLTDLRKSHIADAGRAAPVITAVIDGVSPFLSASIILSPFIIAEHWGFTIKDAYYSSIILAFTIFFLLGAYLGTLSREGIVKSGIKMLLAGVICAIISWLIVPAVGSV